MYAKLTLRFGVHSPRLIPSLPNLPQPVPADHQAAPPPTPSPEQKVPKSNTSPSRLLRYLGERLERLHESLSGLGRRLGEHIAQLVGTHVGDAVREAVRAALNQQLPEPEPDPYQSH